MEYNNSSTEYFFSSPIKQLACKTTEYQKSFLVHFLLILLLEDKKFHSAPKTRPFALGQYEDFVISVDLLFSVLVSIAILLNLQSTWTSGATQLSSSFQLAQLFISVSGQKFHCFNYWKMIWWSQRRLRKRSFTKYPSSTSKNFTPLFLKDYRPLLKTLVTPRSINSF